MDLRVSLLIIGSLIILAIYLYGRRHLHPQNRRVTASKTDFIVKLFRRLLARLESRSEPRHHPSFQQTAPVLDHTELEHLEEIVPNRGAAEISGDEMPMIVELGSEQIAPSGEQLFIPLTLMAKAGRQLNGATIQQAAATASLSLKDDGIYRFEVKDAQGYLQPLLGLANILEPGRFELAQMQELHTPGLVLYLHLPAPIEARAAFENLITVGHNLEELLDAELCDETRSVLTKQTIGHLKEKVEAFRFKQKMTQLQRRRP
jgi:cell division protein ZipA